MNRLEFKEFPPLVYHTGEEMNTLCTNLTFLGAGIKKIMITSCQAAEGKSLLAMNIMRTLAGLGKKVALVDSDLRRSMIDARFDLRYSTPKAYGITHYLADLCDLEDVIYSTNIPGTLFVPVGHEVSNSLPLLNTPRFAHLLEQVSNYVDFVIVDAPPVGLIIDAAEIAKSCDGTIFVVHYNQVSRRQMQEAVRQVERTGCTILGAVINKVPTDTFSSKKYYNKSYYTGYGVVTDKASEAGKDGAWQKADARK